MRILLLFLCMVMGSMELFPQSHYYYNREQIPLYPHPNKVVRALPEKVGGILVLPAEEKNVSEISEGMIKYGCKKHEAELQPAKSVSLLRACQRTYPCYMSEDGRELYPDGYINIKLSNKADSLTLLKVLKDFDCIYGGQNKFMPQWHSARLKDSNLSDPVDVANAIYETGLFDAASPSFIWENPYTDYGLSYDALSSSQTNLLNDSVPGCDINVSRAWNYSTGWGVKIAIIDTGIDLAHPDLVQNLYPISYDATYGVSPSCLYKIEDRSDVRSHGTHCAGIAGAVRNNGIGIAGVAPDVQLMSVSVHALYIPNPEAAYGDAINWAWMNGADVLSCSWSAPKSDIIDDAIINATTRGRDGLGCVVVAASGNYTEKGPIVPPVIKTGYSDNTTDYTIGLLASIVQYPASRKDVLAVGNVTSKGIRFPGSCYGNNLDVVAPGTDIYSTVPGDYFKATGTSMACPHVAGVAALLLSRNPSLDQAGVREIICSTANKIGESSYNENKICGTWNEKYGYGLVDAYKALMQVERVEQ